MRINKKQYYSHRVSYNMVFGFYYNNTFIDHVCMNRGCVNPYHLREVNPQINAIENSVSIPAKRSMQTHCIRGHEFTAENTKHNGTGVYGKKWRQCVACQRVNDKNYKKRKKSV